MQDALANLVYPVVTYALGLKERLDRGEQPELEIEQAAIKGLLLTELEARRWADFGGEAGGENPGAGAGRGDELLRPRSGGGGQPFLGIRYALVCWLDEIFILDSPWETRWNERKLEVALYGTNDRAWKFWEQARRAEARAGRDAVEVFLLCVMLGFRGELRDEPDKLQGWVAATRAQLSRVQAQEWAYPPEIEPTPNVPPLYGRQRFQRMLVAAGAMLLVLIPVLSYLIVQQLGQ